ncbi:MAG: methyl-accepting chemotaxis protein [Minwuia sp.]|uniref:methyl-accepting chemotaxis protein n=1 Tax=Minwuia sp. TaxID=2493630 RepID=UPI003A86697D
MSDKNTDEVPARSKAKGLGRRIVAVVLLGVVLGFGAIIALMITGEQRRTHEFVASGNVEQTRLLAGQIGGAVRFGKADKIEEAYSPLTASEKSPIAAIRVVNLEQAEVLNFNADGFKAPEDDVVAQALATALGEGRSVSVSSGEQQIVAVPATFGPQAAAVGAIAIAWDFSRANAEITAGALTASAIAAVIAALLAVAIVYVLHRLVSQPIRRMTDVMKDLESGNTEVEVPYLSRPDEIGAMATSIESFRQEAIAKAELEAESDANARRAEESRRQAMQDLATEFEEAVGNIVKAVSSAATELEVAASTMRSTVDETNDRSANVASASEQATANVEIVASAAEEMSASIREIGEKASESSSRAGTAEREADETVMTVQQLSATAENIGQVVGMIREIAEQTNLLALNATIEAARAGEAGKGFAVVATEVKNLASETAKATTDISEQIQAIQKATGTSAEAISRVTGAVKELNGIASTIAAAVEEQAAVTRNIAENVQHAATGTKNVTQNIGGVSQAASASSAAAAQVLESAGSLAQQANALNAELDNFLSRVRAA